MTKIFIGAAVGYFVAWKFQIPFPFAKEEATEGGAVTRNAFISPTTGALIGASVGWFMR